MTAEAAGEETLRRQREAAETALAAWAAAWAAHRGTGKAHDAAIRAWATPTRDPEPAAPPAPASRPAEELAWEWQDRVTEALGRVKQRRGISLYEQLPGDAIRHCGRDGCPCTHGRYQNRGIPGDWCDRGFVPTPDDPDGRRETARCPTCRQHAEAMKAAHAEVARRESP